MKYTTILICIISSVLLFVNCGKKDLPAPDPLNAHNTGFSKQGVPVVLTAPCASTLQKNTITYTYSPSGSNMHFDPQVNYIDDYIDIDCRDYSTYNSIRVDIPDKGLFIGKVKFDVKKMLTPTSSTATLTHIFNQYSYYGSYYYYGYEGEIYAEYTKTEIILSFCNVKVQDSNNNNHEVTGQVIIANGR
ncbi:hypothetical protein [uncultured Cytophaga sp.]|uniref:hypothetical protein n=1 Tax=uncultured Cytophaga sp. TaxID=160238 RepID=UPI00260F108C|nr:hypothetical protein [uncultured Cytophaga sp.]